MPYIDPIERVKLDGLIEPLVQELSRSICIGQAGKLNYTDARIVFLALQKRTMSYYALNELIGALECCKLELYRRLVGPYEDVAKDKNGDVFNV